MRFIDPSRVDGDGWRRDHRYAVRKVAIGYAFTIAYSTQRYQSLVGRRHGWRPTKRWAAKVCARKAGRYLSNYDSMYNSSVETNPFEILKGGNSEREVSRTKKDLKKIAEELST